MLPADGSSIGNQAMQQALRDAGHELGNDGYAEIKNALVADGVIGKGRGRGGSIYRIAADQPSTAAPDFELKPQAAPAELDFHADKARAKARGKAAGRKKADQKRAHKRASKASADRHEVLSYRYDDKRRNNPHVGMVDTSSDGVEDSANWAYDPHIDPALQFDPSRAQIESLIDDALASDDKDEMAAALEQLKRMQAAYLNWAGKAERTSFEVDTVSLHVHERIDPATILAGLQKRVKDSKGKDTPSFQADLFHAPFENLPLREAIDFYKHDRDWSNRLIAGDSLLVMNSVLQKEGMAGQVQMIYIDPPYGIKYGSNFQPFTNRRDVKDRKDEDLTQEPEMIKAFRDTWELGIHSYLTYLRDRLLLARELLSESGSVFVQISDENLHHVRELLDEIFGETNFIAQISFIKTTSATSQYLASTNDYLIWYSKKFECLKYKNLFREKKLGAAGTSQYNWARTQFGEDISVNRSSNREDAVFAASDLKGQSGGVSTQFAVVLRGKSFDYGKGGWKTNKKGISNLLKASRIKPIGNSLMYRRYLSDFSVYSLSNSWDDVLSTGFSDTRYYVVQTGEKVIERCILMATDPGDLVLDPTCGSGTTAVVAEKWGRRWITCDTSRVAITLAKQRLMTASYDYYALKYPGEGLRGGFIYKTVPHITLKSIANNPEIDTIYEQRHPAIESALASLNTALQAAPPAPLKITEGARKGETIDFSAKTTRQTLPSEEVVATNALLEWEVPFEAPADWPQAALEALDAFHAARQAMQQALDDSIANHAGQEVLYDQPEVDKSKRRITGPFTVEAVPFATVLGLDEAEQPREADVAVARSGETSRQAQWRDELLKTGVRGKNNQKLKLMDLDPLPGTRYIDAVGTVAHGENGGERVAVSFGPEHAALEQRQVEIAMREAGELFPLPKLLVFCAFTFDPEAAKDIDNIKGVQALKVQMNTDLLTEDLKKGRSSNESFWLMGQPEVELHTRDDGRYQIEVHGFDYFDTKTGELKSGGKKNIALWSLDTDYDNRSLFPRQVFFPMAGKKDGWYKLKKDIRAELNDDLLDAFHGTLSLPFDAGENECVAVKIVDDRGIESLKVINLG
ncbi:site-specific DNA-methyltransferase [Salinisphaera sp. SWV1]